MVNQRKTTQLTRPVVSSVVIHQMSKIEKQTISIILTKYKSIDKHMQATKDNQGGKKISDGTWCTN